MASHGKLFTIGTRGDEQRVIARSADAGKTLWTYEYVAPLPSFMLTNHGVGPRSTPLLAGERLFTVGIAGTLLCLERDSGRLLWRRNLVSELGGSRNTRGEVRQLWADETVRVMFTNAHRLGGHVFVSSGDFGPVPLTAVAVETGKVAWRDRSFARVSMVQPGRRVLVLDEKGSLGLVSLSDAGLTVRSRMQLPMGKAWTAPAVLERRVYVRTNTALFALECRERRGSASAPTQLQA